MRTAENNNAENRRSFFHIFRDVYTINEKTGLQTTHARREWLHVTPSGRHTWKNNQTTAAAFGCIESCRILDNLQRINRTRYNYGKIRN